ncbi:MAG: hypothetical protein U5L09_15410 [Bacteroidales bacterium]|nr:hypothetical protein [Bacteroidales bacterium]
MLPFDASFHFASPVSMTMFLGRPKKKGAPTHIKYNKVSARPFSLLKDRFAVIPMTEIAQVEGWTDEDKLSAQLREEESHSFSPISV